MKRKQINKILGQLYGLSLWPHPWPWPWHFKVRVWNSLISGMGWSIDMEWRGCESSIHGHAIDFCMTMVGGGRMYQVVIGMTPDISMLSTYLVSFSFDSLWPSNAMWWHRSGSTLAQVLACCLMEPNHFPNQLLNYHQRSLWYSSEGNFTRSFHEFNL